MSSLNAVRAGLDEEHGVRLQRREERLAAAAAAAAAAPRADSCAAAPLPGPISADLDALLLRRGAIDLMSFLGQRAPAQSPDDGRAARGADAGQRPAAAAAMRPDDAAAPPLSLAELREEFSLLSLQRAERGGSLAAAAASPAPARRPLPSMLCLQPPAALHAAPGSVLASLLSVSSPSPASGAGAAAAAAAVSDGHSREPGGAAAGGSGASMPHTPAASDAVVGGSSSAASVPPATTPSGSTLLLRAQALAAAAAAHAASALALEALLHRCEEANGGGNDNGGAELAAAHTQALESARLASGVAARLQLLPLTSRGGEPQR